MRKIQKHIFLDHAELEFYDKLRSFHDLFVEQALVTGVAEKNAHIEDIPFSKNPKFTLTYYRKIIGGLTNITPHVLVRCIKEDEVIIDCAFTKIQVDEHINNVYMTQNVMNWTNKKNFCCQVWKLFDTSVKEVNHFWLY